MHIQTYHRSRIYMDENVPFTCIYRATVPCIWLGLSPLHAFTDLAFIWLCPSKGTCIYRPTIDLAFKWLRLCFVYVFMDLAQIWQRYFENPILPGPEQGLIRTRLCSAQVQEISMGLELDLVLKGQL